MAGMEAADHAGGDSRCSCRTQPVPETEARCSNRTAHVAYIAAAKPEDPDGGEHVGLQLPLPRVEAPYEVEHQRLRDVNAGGLAGATDEQEQGCGAHT